jgi:hypothetical protein
MVADGGEESLVEVCTDFSLGEKHWQQEGEKRQRMASAVASMLIRSHPLPRAKRLARSLLKHASEHYPHTPLTKITDKSMEDIMIILHGQRALTRQQTFEYIKAAAARQSHPRQSVVDIAQLVYDLLNIRPSAWVTQALNVITTEDIRIRNNHFIMAAAEGNLAVFQEFLKNKQELTSLHSELHYTALHAAADFGQAAILTCILATGLSIDIKDPVRGQTSLHFAAYSGRTSVARLLLEAGADRRLACSRGILPYQAADKQGHVECRELLKFMPPPVEVIQVLNKADYNLLLLLLLLLL